MFDRHLVRIGDFQFVVGSIARDVTKVGIWKSCMKNVKCGVSSMKKKRLQLVVHI